MASSHLGDLASSPKDLAPEEADIDRQTTADPLLAAKLQPPISGVDLLVRPRLIDAFSESRLGGLLLLAAPAGAGKTSAITAWLSTRDDPTGWFTVEAADNDATRFWAYVAAALKRGAPELGSDVLARVHSPEQLSPADRLTGLVNELATGDRLVPLVFDDYHFIEADEIHDAVAFLAEHAAPRLLLVLSTRQDPPLPLARLRTRGLLTELRAADLNFSEDETAQLLVDTLGLDLADEHINKLYERTEGWAAGLRLAALTLHERDDKAAFIDDFHGDDRHIVDYLSLEVLSSLSAADRTFLLRTSILERVSAPLCDAVTGESGSGERLERFERAGLFVTPLDSRREWYRYHHLFGELLRHDLQRTDRELIPELHCRASDWLAADGQVTGAVSHALEAQDRERAGELIATHWNRYVNRGEVRTVSGWLAAMPERELAADPRLSLAMAWMALVRGELDRVEAWIDTAQEQSVGAPPPVAASSIESGARLARSVHCILSGDVGRACDEARKAVELEQQTDGPGLGRALSALGGALFWLDEPQQARPVLQRAVEHGHRHGQYFAVLLASGFLAALDADLPAGADVAENALHTAAEHGLAWHNRNAMAHTVHGQALGTAGDFVAAEEEFSRGLELARQGREPLQIAYTLLALADLRFQQGQNVQDLIGEARALRAGCPDPGILPQLIARTASKVHITSAEALPASGLVEELTDRELAVLRQLPTALSQREIASELYISWNTVKTHIKAIYRKLGVTTRHAAVRRAQDLGLLTDPE